MNRRRFVLVAGTAGMVGVAGCLGFGDDGDDDTSDDDANGDPDTNGDENGDPLEAAFEFEPENPDPGEEVTFDASDSTGDIAVYGWVLEPMPEDDGTESLDLALTEDDFERSNDPTRTHTFEEPGRYVVILSVTDTEDAENGAVSEASAVIPVGDVVEATFDWRPEEPAAGQEVTLDASESTGDIVEYRWDVSGNDEFDITTDDPTLTHTFEETGGQSILLEVEIEDGRTDSVEEAIFVGTEEADPGDSDDNDDDDDEEPVTASFTVAPSEPEPGEEVTFDASESTGDIAEFRWDLTGDGQFDVTTDEPILTHTFDHRQRPEVTLEIEGESGSQIAVDRQRVTVGHDDAVDLIFTPPDFPEIDTEVTFEVGAAGGPDPIVEFRWDFTGDGDADVTTEDTSVTHVFEEPGATVVTLLAEDESGRIGVWTERVVAIDPSEIDD